VALIRPVLHGDGDDRRYVYDPDPTDWPHLPTEHPCADCGFSLGRVMPSNMLVCDNPVCDAEPRFLIPHPNAK
jgi:hypothetical protein